MTLRELAGMFKQSEEDIAQVLQVPETQGCIAAEERLRKATAAFELGKDAQLDPAEWADRHLELIDAIAVGEEFMVIGRAGA